jgi:hypothetical protein
MDRREFLGAALAVGAVVTPARLGSLQAPTPARTKRQILQAKGLEIVESERRVYLHGVNLGGWMLIEDYMIGLPWTEWKIREQFRKILGADAYEAFFHAYDEAYIAEADISFLSHQGFNFVRLPFNYRHFEDDLAPGKWMESGFRQLDRVVGLCRKYGLWVMLDLHAAPGAQARDQNAGSAYGESYLWKYRDFVDRTVALWGEIARRFSGDATIAGYNLLCEPVTDNVPLLNELYSSIIRTIRKVDRDHLILLDGNLWAKDIGSLHDELFIDPQVLPTLHHYFDENRSWAELSAYPTVVAGKAFDRAALQKTLDGKYDQQRIPRPVIVAEFGVSRSSPQPFPVQLAITRDLVSIFEENGWGWSMWCYKDLRMMGLVTPRADTPWRKFLDSPQIDGFLRRYRALEQPFTQSVTEILAGTDISEDTRSQWGREVSRDFDAPALEYILLRLKDRSPAELIEMARSFSFSSCDIHQDQFGVLKPFLTP